MRIVSYLILLFCLITVLCSVSEARGYNNYRHSYHESSESRPYADRGPRSVNGVRQRYRGPRKHKVVQYKQRIKKPYRARR